MKLMMPTNTHPMRRKIQVTLVPFLQPSYPNFSTAPSANDLVLPMVATHRNLIASICSIFHSKALITNTWA
ncbi:hypothetical protein L484_018428 [Morus notabilis]|uniref:Uncharacterized protein n=1 Tax=Morus notabilis TaxID=981085 RepID=W9QK85_9ROSA|nr:hypothetical protein L484_018428 [Morus notabilis]